MKNSCHECLTFEEQFSWHFSCCLDFWRAAVFDFGYSLNDCHLTFWLMAWLLKISSLDILDAVVTLAEQLSWLLDFCLDFWRAVSLTFWLLIYFWTATVLAFFLLSRLLKNTCLDLFAVLYTFEEQLSWYFWLLSSKEQLSWLFCYSLVFLAAVLTFEEQHSWILTSFLTFEEKFSWLLFWHLESNNLYFSAAVMTVEEQLSWPFGWWLDFWKEMTLFLHSWLWKSNCLDFIAAAVSFE